MELPGHWTLEELEGADRWSSGPQELVISVLRVPAAEPLDRATLLADLSNSVAQSRQAVRNFARGALTLEGDSVMHTEGDLVSASYVGAGDDGREVYVAVRMTTRAIEGLAYVASLYIFAPSARALGPSVASSLELGGG